MGEAAWQDEVRYGCMFSEILSYAQGEERDQKGLWELLKSCHSIICPWTVKVHEWNGVYSWIWSFRACILNLSLSFLLGFLVAQTVRNLPAVQETRVQPLLVRSPGEGHGSPLQYSYLENSVKRGTWRTTAMGSQIVRQNWVTNTFTFFQPSFRSGGPKSLLSISFLLFCFLKHLFYVFQNSVSRQAKNKRLKYTNWKRNT